METPSEPPRPFVPVVIHRPPPSSWPPSPAQQHRLPKRRELSALAWLGICAGATLVLAAGLSLVWAVRTADSPSSGADSPRVTITDCDRSSDRTVRITYEITNRGQRARSVFVDFSVVDSSGTRLGTATAIELDLAPGKTAVGDAVALLPGGRTASRCLVDEVR